MKCIVCGRKPFSDSNFALGLQGTRNLWCICAGKCEQRARLAIDAMAETLLSERRAEEVDRAIKEDR